jgi:nucleotide-binding universal stress UspA family protein
MASPQRIVVGVDDSEGACRALRFAMEEAALRGASLDVVHAYSEHRFVALRVPADPGASAPAEHEAKEFLDRLVADTLDVVEHRPAEVNEVAVNGTEGPSLVEGARDAALLIVGSRGRGPVTSAVLGSTSHYCVDHAPCPVVVVPDANL